jgi:hypothetical protein
MRLLTYAVQIESDVWSAFQNHGEIKGKTLNITTEISQILVEISTPSFKQNY